MEERKRKYPFLNQKKAAESSENQNTLLERQRNHLSRHRRELVQRIPTMSVVDCLSDLHGAPEEEIQSKRYREGDCSANRHLLKSVMKYDDGYVKLVKALEEIGGVDNLVEKLSKDEEGSLMKEVEHTEPPYRFDKHVALQDLSGEIQNEWKAVGRKLGLDESKLYYLERDYSNQGHKETVYQMLLTWKRRTGSQATHRVLGEALKAAGRRDLQEMLYKQATIQNDN